MNRESQGHKNPERLEMKAKEQVTRSSHTPIVLVPLDGSAEAKSALPVGRLVAGIVGAGVHVIHAAEKPLSRAELLLRIGLSREETHEMVVDQVVGDASESIVSVAEEKGAKLIVMTTRGHTAYLGRTVRPVVEQIISKAPCPVLLVRPEIGLRVAEMRELRRILLPLDGAPSSAAVIGPALELAQRSGAEVDILYVATQAKRPEERGTLTTPLYVDQPQHEWPVWAQEFLRRFGTCLGQRPLPTPTRLFLGRGKPAAEILRFAVERNVDLVVLEWRGRLDHTHATVVRGVLRDTPCPVLLLRTMDSPSKK